jgi:hypothetical protein
MEAFLVRMPSGVRYWTVIDNGLRPVPAADAYLRHIRFGRLRCPGPVPDGQGRAVASGG